MSNSTLRKTVTQPNNSILSVQSLGIRRSERWLFQDLSFTLNLGELMQVVGVNGAGKTSLLRCLCGLLPKAKGEYRWGQDDDMIPLYLGHLPAVKPELTVFENLKLHPIAGKFAANNDIDQAIFEVDLEGYEDELARTLSAGQTRRVGLARLLLADSRCWVLDEPFTSLDVGGCQWLEKQMIKYVDKGGAVLLTSHQPLTLLKNPRILTLEKRGLEL